MFLPTPSRDQKDLYFCIFESLLLHEMPELRSCPWVAYADATFSMGLLLPLKVMSQSAVHCKHYMRQEGRLPFLVDASPSSLVPLLVPDFKVTAHPRPFHMAVYRPRL